MTLSDLPLIWQGWLNSFRKSLDLLSEEQKSLAQKRLASCLVCKYAKESKIRRIINLMTGQKGKVEIGKCGVCSCYLLEKTLSWASECPLRNPSHRHPTDEEFIKTYPEPQRWGRVAFDKDGKLISPEAIYDFSPN